jgi:hypothetical protein
MFEPLRLIIAKPPFGKIIYHKWGVIKGYHKRERQGPLDEAKGKGYILDTKVALG